MLISTKSAAYPKGQLFFDYGKIIFTTFAPSGLECSAGGKSWLYELPYLPDKSATLPALDISKDGKLTDDGNDAFTKDITIGGSTYNRFPVGVTLGDGQAARPTIIAKGKLDLKLIGMDNGSVTSVLERGRNDRGRISWQQIK